MTIEEVNKLLLVLPLLAEDVAALIVKLLNRAGFDREQLLGEAGNINADTLSFIEKELARLED